MDANTFFTLAIAAIVIPVAAYDQIKKRLPGRATPISAIQDLAEDTQLPARAWLDYVNAQPDTVPHVAVIGPSGAGKTTLTTALLSDRTGQIVVITAKEGDHWGGLPYVGIDLDATYATANATFHALEAEIKQRLVAVKQSRMTADWMTIVVDDFSTLVKECPIAADVVKLTARLGRSLRVRLVMLSDSALVKAIGLEGEGETRGNFAFMRLRRGHGGTLEIEGKDIAIDTSGCKQIAQGARLHTRAWRPAGDAEAELHTLFDTGMGVQFRGADTSIRYRYRGGIPDIDAVSAGIDLTPHDRAIMAILVTNPDASKNAIYSAVGGNRNVVFARIDVLKELP